MKAYNGRSVLPRREPVVYCCPCGERFGAEVWRAISAEDSLLRTRLIEGDLNRVRCPRCDAAADVQISVLYHDGPSARLILVAPSSERHRELALRGALFAQLAEDATPPPAYVLHAELVFGASGLSDLLAASAVETRLVAPLLPPRDTTGPQPSIERDREPLTSWAWPAPTPLPSASLGSPGAGLLTPGAELTSPLLDGDLTHPRATVNVPDPRGAVIERWIAARESATAFFVDEHVVVCAALSAAALEQFVGRDGERPRLSIRPQLHRMASFPLLVLTFVAGEDGERPDEPRVVQVPLDLSRAAHRIALDQLQRVCAISLELFDSEYLPVVSSTLTLPFEEHLRHLVIEAKAAMDKLPVATRDFERARLAFLGAGYDRLGRTAIDLPTIDEVLRGGPAQVRASLALVARWSEAPAETYLLEIRGFSISQWRQLTATAVRRAVDLGIFVPRSLAERVVRRSEDALELPAWPDLVDLLIRRFAELSARLKPNDLAPVDEAANWELLLREAEVQALVVDAAIERLADAAFIRVGGRPSRRQRASTRAGAAAGRADVAAVKPAAAVSSTPSHSTAATPTPPAGLDSTVILLSRLEDRDTRLESALALAARKEASLLPALFVLLRRLSRAEAAVLLPRLATFGAPAERWLIDGLRSRKAFMRQGCALALGQLASPVAVDALVRLLFEEPTEIWGEIARAIGDVGAPAVMLLAARLREREGDFRERIIVALAHIAARTSGPPSSRAAVEALATGRDALVANAARRALVLAPQVLSAHQAVRTEPREQTLVRAFTRRFYDVLEAPPGGESDAEIRELDAEDLLAIDDDLGEDEVDEFLDLEALEPSINPSLNPSLNPDPSTLR